jgi:hypothetical protein
MKTPFGRNGQKTNPQITQMDADNITKGLGLYLRYLRHLRAGLGGWADRVSSDEYRVSGGRVEKKARPKPR